MNELAGARVLVVDDDDSVRESSARMARIRLGLGEGDVLTANCGRDAVRVLAAEEAAGRRVDAVLSDFSMPNWNGAQLYDQIEARWPELAKSFVMQTGDASNGKVQELVGRGVTVIEKTGTYDASLVLRRVILDSRAKP